MTSLIQFGNISEQFHFDKLPICCFAKPRNTIIYGISTPSEAQHVMFLKGRLANTAGGSVCGGSGAQELHSIRFLMTGGRDE